jgi:hypothetical protein
MSMASWGERAARIQDHLVAAGREEVVPCHERHKGGCGECASEAAHVLSSGGPSRHGA